MDENHHGCMVLDDEADDVDFSNFQSVGAERIPMKIIENLCGIWVPAHLLQKRKNFAAIHLKRPAMFRTLEKPEKSFSVYYETQDKDQPENFSAAEFAEEDMLDLLNNYKSLEANNISGSDGAISATGTSKSSEIDNYESVIKSCNSDKFLSSPKESLEPKCLEKNSETLTFCDQEINDYVKSACLKTFAQTNHDSVRNSFDDIYNSDDEFCEEARCTMSEEVLNGKCDSLVAPLNISKKFSVSMDKNFESDTVEGACCNPDFEGSLQTDSLKGSQIDNVDPKKHDESGGVSKLVNFPIAYKRKPVIEETVKKQKKEKKKKNSQKKTVLDVFTQNDDSECQFPKVDEFYESIMSQEYERYISREYDQPYECEYPSLKNELPDVKHNNSPSEETSKFEEFKETVNLVEDKASPSVNSTKLTSGSLEIKGVHIVLENIPKHVSEKQVQDLLHIGEVKLLYLSQCGGFKIAEISMESDTDAEWIVDCFNGNAPFGAGSPTLKCYKLS